MEKHDQLAENLIQGGVPEKQMWKERLRKEILEEEKERIMKFVELEVKKKMLEIEQLLEIGGEPSRVVLLPIDPSLPKLGLGLENGSSFSYQLVSPGTGTDGGVKAVSELGLALLQDASAENPRNPVEEAKAKEQPTKRKFSERHVRPTKKQKTTGSKWSCPLCSVTATSHTNLNKHFLGKKHKAKSLEIQRTPNSNVEGAHAGKETAAKGLPMKVQANGKLFLVYKKGNSLWCNNGKCDFTCASSVEMVVHLTGPEHEVCDNGKEGKPDC